MGVTSTPASTSTPTPTPKKPSTPSPTKTTSVSGKTSPASSKAVPETGKPVKTVSETKAVPKAAGSDNPSPVTNEDGKKPAGQVPLSSRALDTPTRPIVLTGGGGDSKPETAGGLTGPKQTPDAGTDENGNKPGQASPPTSPEGGPKPDEKKPAPPEKKPELEFKNPQQQEKYDEIQKGLKDQFSNDGIKKFNDKIKEVGLEGPEASKKLAEFNELKKQYDALNDPNNTDTKKLSPEQKLQKSEELKGKMDKLMESLKKPKDETRPEDKKSEEEDSLNGSDEDLGEEGGGAGGPEGSGEGGGAAGPEGPGGTGGGGPSGPSNGDSGGTDELGEEGGGAGGPEGSGEGGGAGGPEGSGESDGPGGPDGPGEAGGGDKKGADLEGVEEILNTDVAKFKEPKEVQDFIGKVKEAITKVDEEHGKLVNDKENPFNKNDLPEEAKKNPEYTQHQEQVQKLTGYKEKLPQKLQEAEAHLDKLKKAGENPQDGGSPNNPANPKENKPQAT